MSRAIHLSAKRIQELREQIERALQSVRNSGGDQKVIEALHSSLELLDVVAEPTEAFQPPRHRGSIDYTLEDDSCPPYGRQVQVRVYYDWDDYNPADEPFPIWGARIEDFQVVAVNYYDQNGQVVELDAHHRDVAVELMAKEREAVVQACTDDGCRRGIGVPHPLYTPMQLRLKPQARTRRMAPSERTREQKMREQRKSM